MAKVCVGENKGVYKSFRVACMQNTYGEHAFSSHVTRCSLMYLATASAWGARFFVASANFTTLNVELSQTVCSENIKAHWLRQKTDALLANASDKERALFAYTYAKEPEAFPTEPYMDKATVDAVFWNILRRMGVLSSTEDFQEFLQEQDIVIENE